MVDKKLVFIITGPTGVGKTDLALSIANKLPSEIVNIDVGQFYKPFTIGTAKPDWQNEPIPHHLFDIIDEPKDFTVSEYKELVMKTIHQIWDKNKLPILVGGSGFYIQSLFFPPQAKIKSKLDMVELNIIKTDTQLWQKLYEIDPVRAQAIDKNDIYRIQRALDIWQETGIKPSMYVPVYHPEFNFIFIVLTRERDELYERINKRVLQMINSGWINEVKKIKHSNWNLFLKDKKLIGYDDILHYLESDSEYDQDLLVEKIQQKTRNYAKRQITFLKMLTKKIITAQMNSGTSQTGLKKIEWIDLTSIYINSFVEDIIKNF